MPVSDPTAPLCPGAAPATREMNLLRVCLVIGAAHLAFVTLARLLGAGLLGAVLLGWLGGGLAALAAGLCALRPLSDRAMPVPPGSTATVAV